MGRSSNNVQKPCTLIHYKCPCYHTWDGKRTAEWFFGTIGALGAAYLLGLLLWSIGGSVFAGDPPAVRAAKVQQDTQREAIEAEEKKTFAANCKAIGGYVSEPDRMTLRECKKP